jgi:hypothetical protein
MTVTLTTFESNLQTKLNNTTGTTDGQEFLLLSKSVEALNPSITVAAVQTEGTTQVSNVNTAGTTQVSAVNSAGTTQVAAVQAAGSGYAALTGATFSGAIDMGSNNITTTGKVLYANMYATPGDLPSASTYHGLFAHTHSNGRAVFSHNSNWYNLLHEDSSGDVTIANDLTVTGGLIVNGTTTTINSTTLDVDDLNITVAKGAADAATANGGGITVDGANATFNYASSGDKWTMNKPLDVTRARSNSVGETSITIAPNDTVISYGVRVDQATNSWNFDRVDNPTNLMSLTTSGDLDVTGAVTATGATVNGKLDIEEVFEKVQVSTTTSGTITFPVDEYGVRLQSVNQTANRTINFSNVNANLAIGQSVTCAIAMTQGSTAYYLNAYQIDGSSVTPKWVGGAPTGGTASAIDSYTFTIIKTADATFTVLANLTAYE